VNLALLIGRRTVRVLIGSFILTVVACFLWVLISGFIKYQQSNRAVEVLRAARQFDVAIQQQALDAATTDDSSLGYPADTREASAREYLARYAGSYLKAEEVDEYGKLFLIGNVSKQDPPETIVLKSKPGVISGGGCVIFRKAGDGAILQSRQVAHIPGDPQRDPPYLAE
jgi:hypothetical protein